jgi:phospholipase/lecithinase/hemolysin
MAKPGIAALALGVSLVIMPCAHASSYDAIYSFGDSLSDVGNDFAAAGIPGAPYYDGNFSNGPVSLQTLASGLGLAPLTPSLLGGTDYAFGGAETGNASFDTAIPATDLLGPTGQLAQFNSTHTSADPNALYTLWFGSNDLEDIPVNATPTQVATDIATIAANIDTAINTLAAEGAKDFLIFTVPDLGKTPDAIAGGPLAVAEASALSANFDSVLVNGFGPIPSLANLAAADGLNLKVLNTYPLLDQVVANYTSYGLTDVTDPCFNTLTNSLCTTPNQYLFFDGQHPTETGQVLIGDAALALETPEPASICLLATGLAAGLALFRRSRRATA